ncbi:MAG TPA: hypothetical protein VM888_10920 [Chitinophagaceae bacterium]|jgi:hypothetical protein|nr:hypothetical protein [Chitinophagaceae bacterium]
MNNEHQHSFLANSSIETQIWNYIDGLSNDNEKRAVETMISGNENWQTKYKELLEVHQLMQAAEVEQPSLRFTKNVMEEIAKYSIAPATKKYINHKIIWSIALFFIITIAGLVIYSVGQSNPSAPEALTISGIDFSKIDYSSWFTNKFVMVFMMVNVVLGLMLVDRILLNRKRKLKNT